MDKLQVLIDRTPNNYSASAAWEGHVFLVTGKTIDEVKRELQEAIKVTHEWLTDEGQMSVLDQLECEYTLTISALLASLCNVLTRTALSKATGISPKQLSHYATGVRKPREAQANKIREGVRSIGLQLAQV